MEVGEQATIKESRVGREKQRYDGDVRLIVCIVPLNEKNEILLISSSKHKDGWILPKGGWENDESIEECAIRELEEEAGVEGYILRSIGQVDYRSGNKSDVGNPSRLLGFVVRVTKEFKEWSESTRLRKWVDFNAARSMLGERTELIQTLDRAFEIS